MDTAELFRAIPSVDYCLSILNGRVDAPRILIKAAVAEYLKLCRSHIKSGETTLIADLIENRENGDDIFCNALINYVKNAVKPRFRRVLNATGVVVHTNLGRSVLAKEAVEAVNRVCSGYGNLEFDLDTGKRGSRYALVEELLCRLTGAEAAVVVNNNAAAVYLTLVSLCCGKEAVVARGQLVEIGGNFRIPDIMKRSGVILREVGCTNRVHPCDYIEAVSSETAALMRVHTSNFRVVGFHSDVPLSELAAIGHERGLLVIEDLGSGSLVRLNADGLTDEPTVRESVAAGADAVMFSGDKVLGGPQAGIIVGKKEVIAQIKADPMNRALRVDKMTLAALEATLRLYLDDSVSRTHIPTIWMISASADELKIRARRLASRLRRAIGGKADIAVVPSISRVGGGAFPEQNLHGWAVRLIPTGISAETLRERLLAADTPLVGRIVENAFLLDCRTLADDEWNLAINDIQASL